MREKEMGSENASLRPALHGADTGAEPAGADDMLAALQTLLRLRAQFTSSDRNQADAYNAFVKGKELHWRQAIDAVSKATGK